MDLDSRPIGGGKAPPGYVWVALVVVTIGVFVGAGLLWDGLFGTSISGSIVAEGSEVGSWTFVPDVCESGFRRSFYGVRMFSSHDSHFAFVYVEDPTRGRSIEVKVPDKDEGYRFFERDCATLDASVQTGAIINNVRSTNGTINLDCKAQGGSLRGSLKFENCH
ncbi:MAG TPA: hypothetical protein VFL62_02165 [Bradyrhizobium sp.]|uniref:hypothetical protein n=1 Tax=Bradyrhizobium sp. TaxID=376 RepID=UPI002D7FA0E1|nr:hypothetical protein [Bradyrhizobium sp.]HET7885009.1 hypothetical protein [Bradyrhizobium sp.]